MSAAIFSFLISAFLGGLIGWVTNWLAIKALFHPYEPHKFLFIEYQGLLPKRQKELAVKLGELVEKQLINVEELAKNVGPEDVNPLVDEMVKKIRIESENQLKNYLQNSKISMLISLNGLVDSAMNSIEQKIGEIVKAQVPAMLESATKKVTEKISVQEIVRDRVSNMALDKLEKIFNDISDKEMKAILRLGGAIGVMVGVIQWAFQNYILPLLF